MSELRASVLRTNLAKHVPKVKGTHGYEPRPATDLNEDRFIPVSSNAMANSNISTYGFEIPRRLLFRLMGRRDYRGEEELGYVLAKIGRGVTAVIETDGIEAIDVNTIDYDGHAPHSISKRLRPTWNIAGLAKVEELDVSFHMEATRIQEQAVVSYRAPTATISQVIY